ncbi:MAG TPA: hypothetical protein VGX95_02890 [Xanthobacteraceae bacterium]|jgi:hypothetical protein|nr:hypothetical protein [Xanthobacteraceae bacterium]
MFEDANNGECNRALPLRGSAGYKPPDRRRRPDHGAARMISRAGMGGWGAARLDRRRPIVTRDLIARSGCVVTHDQKSLP